MFMSNLYMLSSNKLALKPLKVALIQSKVIYTSALFRQQQAVAIYKKKFVKE